MKKAYLQFILIFLIVVKVFAQPPAIQWTKSYGGTLPEICYRGIQTSDHGFALIGSTQSNDSDVSGHHGIAGITDYWFVKTDSLGNLQWQKCYGGSGYDEGFDLAETSDSGFVIIGTSNSIDGDVTTNFGGFDCWLVKIDAAGIIQWQKTYGGPGTDEGRSVIQLSDGSYVFLASYNSPSSSFNYWLVKTDSAGTIQWQHQYGGLSYDEAWNLKEDFDHGFIITGYSESNDSNLTSNNGYTDCWIIKVDNEGGIVWQKNYGSSSSDVSYSIIQTSDSGYAFVGQPLGNDSDVTCARIKDYWLVKLDTAGNIMWQNCYGGSGTDLAYDLKQTIDGGFIIAGNSVSVDGDVTGNHGNDYWVVKTNSTGNLEWQKCAGGSLMENARSIIETSDGGYAAIGHSRSNNGDVTDHRGLTNYDDFWLVKLAPPLGALVSKNEESTFSISPNPTGNILNIQCSQSYIEILIYDISGTIQYTGKYSMPQVDIDISKLPSGIFFIKLQSDKGTLTQKFVKTE